MTPWERTTRADWAVSRLADRHYSRQKPGARQFSPPGMNLTLKVGGGDVALAGWVWWHPHRNAPRGRYDGYDGWVCCSFFRNEGTPYLSSDLVRAAVVACLCLWNVGDMAVPLLGFDTYVQPASIASPNPGYCFQRAGWHRTDDWTKDGKKRRLVLPLGEAPGCPADQKVPAREPRHCEMHRGCMGGFKMTDRDGYQFDV